MNADQAASITRSSRTGLPVIYLGMLITSEDVRALEDDGRRPLDGDPLVSPPVGDFGQ
jgi:hypothetical protein